MVKEIKEDADVVTIGIGVDNTRSEVKRQTLVKVADADHARYNVLLATPPS
jgi:nicotinamide mononucleotide adenylyltransferase